MNNEKQWQISSYQHSRRYLLLIVIEDWFWFLVRAGKSDINPAYNLPWHCQTLQCSSAIPSPPGTSSPPCWASASHCGWLVLRGVTCLCKYLLITPTSESLKFNSQLFEMARPTFSSLSLVESFKALYNKREQSNTTDFTVFCQNGSEIPVHSLVLSAR